MKILLIAGASGSGKSTIAKKLCENYKYNLVCSYTDRSKRDKNDTDHIFVDSNYMDLLLERSDIVAQSKINAYRYCTIRSQFVDDKINVYIVDVNGMNDIFDSFPYASIMSLLIRRTEIDVDCIRQGRDVVVPSRDDVDFLIDNNTKVESAVGTINALVGFDFFVDKPSHRVETIQEKLDYIDNQYRYLNEIRDSLYEQIWYQYRPLYLKMCQYVQTMINKEFDYEINIIPDTCPSIFDGELEMNVIGEYKKGLQWTETHHMVERMSFYARNFCKENNCENILYYLVITDQYIGD